ncbi:Carboxylesterase [Lachnellula willkommii]|uniref:Carboxylesterase n=1 Tax=Lachnellula willkommii TaxID=215461 RepID=A0A559MJ74_9HELO|nr:Carboxylesterase [Lachnellula willkommii]
MQSNASCLTYDPELALPISNLQHRPTSNMREFITAVRSAYPVVPTEDITANLQHHGINCRDEILEVSENTVVKVAILSSSASNSASLHCGLVWYHGGGGVSGNRFGGLRYVTDLIQIFGIIVISVEYRLAPEHPAPIPQDDCYAALTWAASSVYNLGIDPEKLMVGGSSAGAGLAASVALRARDNGGIKLCGQLLINPMLDDRNETMSSYRCTDERIWGRASNICAWTALLGDGSGSADISPYVAPARAKDLSSLPSTFITVGSEEPFRDEASIYAERIRDSSGSVEIHIWNGAYHAFESLAPQAELSKLAVRTRRSWIAQTFGLENRLRDEDQTMIHGGGHLM